MNCLDPKRKYIRSYLYISEDSFLSKTAFNGLYFILGFVSFLTSYIFFISYLNDEGGMVLIFMGCLFIPLGVYAITNRKTILITDEIYQITYYLKFFRLEKIFKVYERPMHNFDSICRFDTAFDTSGNSTYGNGQLYLEFDDGYSIVILYFRLKRDCHDLFFDTKKKIERIIGIEITINDQDRRRLHLEHR